MSRGWVEVWHRIEERGNQRLLKCRLEIKLGDWEVKLGYWRLKEES